MPKQYVCFGRRVPRMGARRISYVLLAAALFVVMSLIVALESTIYSDVSYDHVKEHMPKMPKLPDMPKFHMPWSDSILNPFRPPSHPPPRQKNDTYGISSWWADWKWLHVPFSSSMTLDEDRALLPPLKERPPIYCYYDVTIDKDAASKDAESDLLLTWRRAWWAQGFKPVILSASEAMNNPLYKELQRYPDMHQGLKTDLMRWLAWEHMGGGLLAYYTTLPMGPREDPLLSSLRRGEYPKLMRWAGIEDGLFSGVKTEIYDALKETFEGTQIKNAKDILEAVPEALLEIDDKPKAIAYYDASVIAGKYSKVAQSINENRAKGLKSLNQLINSHLHLAWQTIFTDGIAVLKPLPHHSTHMVTDAWQLAQDLASCSETPMTASCPPNNVNCKRCRKDKPMKILTPGRYHNSTSLYTIGTVPHPVTTALLSQLRENIDFNWIRRESPRDPWLTAVTKELLDDEFGQSPRVLRFKEAVAGEFAPSRSLWLTAEHHLVDEQMRAQLDWHFGFAIPHPIDRGDFPPLATQEHDPKDGPKATQAELDAEPGILARAKTVFVAGRGSEKPTPAEDDMIRLRAAVEAWNLADSEVWKFARAFLDRRILERQEWEQEESRYASGSGSEHGRQKGWTERWSDNDEN